MKQHIFLLAASVFIIASAYCQLIEKVHRWATISPYRNYMQANQQKHMQEFFDFISIPCISSLPAHQKDMTRAAESLKNKLQSIGMVKTEVYTTEGNPIVFAQWNKANGKPTVHFEQYSTLAAIFTNN